MHSLDWLVGLNHCRCLLFRLDDYDPMMMIWVYNCASRQKVSLMGARLELSHFESDFTATSSSSTESKTESNSSESFEFGF